uniref:ETS domain-containing protein n=1 Tax=Caenorhabditis japonica TaxID=281687 RepID=A0A8R1HMJ8_CAEJA
MYHSPALACPAPVFLLAPKRDSPWSADPALSSNLAFTSTTDLSLSGPSAFTAVEPSHGLSSLTTTTAATFESLSKFLLYQEYRTTTAIETAAAFETASSIETSNVFNTASAFDTAIANAAAAAATTSILTSTNNASNVVPSQMNAASFKPIPNNDKVDLARFRVKDPNEWLVEDVVAWMLDVAKRHNIPFEEMNMHKFSMVSGQEMLTMSERCFIERDPVFGNLIFTEFRKTLENSEDTTLDNVIGTFVDDEVPTTSAASTLAGITTLGLQPMINSITTTIAPQVAPQLSQIPVMQHQLNNLNTLTQALTHAQNFNPSILTPQQTASAVQSLNLASSLAAGLTSGLSPLSVNYLHGGLNPTSPLLTTPIQTQNLSPLLKYSCTISTEYEVPEERSTTSSNLKIKKNKDGKPRKRSQHTKGNKLWEFIRDALKDPSTCPSVVRWEDPIEGVFRIVESEKLARLWGARKNNEKMTYEKLSRAMRTYYEKQILVPVPKTGLYPKKLVYKFGPGAHGWENVKNV